MQRNTGRKRAIHGRDARRQGRGASVQRADGATVPTAGWGRAVPAGAPQELLGGRAVHDLLHAPGHAGAAACGRGAPGATVVVPQQVPDVVPARGRGHKPHKHVRVGHILLFRQRRVGAGREDRLYLLLRVPCRVTRAAQQSQASTNSTALLLSLPICAVCLVFWCAVSARAPSPPILLAAQSPHAIVLALLSCASLWSCVSTRTSKIQLCQCCVCLECIAQGTRPLIANHVACTCDCLVFFLLMTFGRAIPLCRSSSVSVVFIFSASPSSHAPMSPISLTADHTALLCLPDFHTVVTCGLVAHSSGPALSVLCLF